MAVAAAALMLCASTGFSLDLSSVVSLTIPEGEVARVEVGGKTVWPSIPYVTNGLIAYWDGAWNAGLGVHDSSATNWVDLSGNGLDLAVNLGICAWGSDGMSISRTVNDTNHYASAGRPITNALTVELVLKRDGNALGCSFSTGRGAGLTHNRWLAFRADNSADMMHGGPKTTIPPTMQQVGFTIAGVWESIGGENLLYVNGQRRESEGSGFNSGQQNADAGFGSGAGNYYDHVASGTRYYSGRIYNRALSAEEIAHNAAIDAVRFGIGGGK